MRFLCSFLSLVQSSSNAFFSFLCSSFFIFIVAFYVFPPLVQKKNLLRKKRQIKKTQKTCFQILKKLGGWQTAKTTTNQANTPIPKLQH